MVAVQVGLQSVKIVAAFQLSRLEAHIADMRMQVHETGHYGQTTLVDDFCAIRQFTNLRRNGNLRDFPIQQEHIPIRVWQLAGAVDNRDIA